MTSKRKLRLRKKRAEARKKNRPKKCFASPPDSIFETARAGFAPAPTKTYTPIRSTYSYQMSRDLYMQRYMKKMKVRATCEVYEDVDEV